jgi:hypothetical protein
MYLEKSQSVQLPSPSTSSSNYTRRPSLATQQQQRLQQSQEAQLPSSPGPLAHHGIKVRDFAYESDLPLIPSIPRVRQLVLAARPLKRAKRRIEELDDVFMVDTQSQSQSGAAESFRLSSLEPDPDTSERSVNQSKPLERKTTEPVIIPERQRQHLFRDVRYPDLSQHASSSQALQRGVRHALTPISPTTNRLSTFSPTPLPFPFPTTSHGPVGDSQETEQSTDTDTPLVTPSNSLTWPIITGDVPVSQLDNNSVSQLPVAEDTTYSQLGFSSPLSQAFDDDSHTDMDDKDNLGSPQPTEPASGPPDPAPPTAAPRYFLRKHGLPGQDPASPPSSPRRRRKSSTKAKAPPSPSQYPSRGSAALTRQAMHAAASGSSGPSLRSRPLRKATIS